MLSGAVLESLEPRALLAHIPGTVQFDEHAEVFGELATGTTSLNPVIVGGLVPDTSVTLESNPNATGPLNWSDPSSWVPVVNGSPVFTTPGHVPQSGDNVLITVHTTVVINGNEEAINADGTPIAPDPLLAGAGANSTGSTSVQSTASAGASTSTSTSTTPQPASIHTIRVDGTLQFATNVNTKLLVDTIIVEPWGTYQMGTQAAPIQQGVKADVVFTSGPIDTTWDPYEFSRGLLTHGAVSIYGQTVTSDEAVLPNGPGGITQLTRGTKTITLSSAPTNWQVGDRLIITGDTVTSNSGTSQDEQVAIAGLSTDTNGNTVVTITDTYSPTTGADSKYTGLAYEHDAPAGGSIYVADVTRNVAFESQNPSVVAQRGHVMFMHNGNVQVYGAGFYGLGRTDKRTPIVDPNPVPDPSYTIDPNNPDAHLTDDIIDMTDWPANSQSLVPVLDANGHAIPVLVNGQTVPLTDALGNAVLARDASGNLIPVRDALGNPVKNPDGSIKYQVAIEYQMQTEAQAGIPVGRVLEPVHDAAGNSIPVVDANGAVAQEVDASGHAIPIHGLNGLTVVDPSGNPLYQVQYQLQIARSGTNPRGRYAVHFHRTGTDPGSTEASLIDSSVVDAVGWGIVNHSSNVNVTGNVVYNAVGAAYVTEAGDELGQFVNNIAIHGQGAGGGIEDRQAIGDFGQLGDGFWLQGGNVTLSGNIASGMHHSGIVFFPVGLNQAGLGVTQIAYANLDPKVQAALYDGSSTIKAAVDAAAAAVAAGTKPTPVMVPDGDVPLRGFSNNVATADGDGLETWFSLLDFSNAALAKIASDPNAQLQTIIQGFSVWNTNGTGVFSPYTNSITYQNVNLLRSISTFNKSGILVYPSGTGFDRNNVTANATYNDVNVQGYTVGINVPVNGNNLIQGGTFDNAEDILITTANQNRVVNINDGPNGDLVNFVDKYAKVTTTTTTTTVGTTTTRTTTVTVTPLQQWHIYLQTNYNPMDGDITRLFSKDVIQMGTVMHNGVQLYYLQQAANFVPFAPNDPTVPSFIPIEFREQLDASGNPILDASGNPLPMTNAMIFAKYGLAIGGAVAPSDATQSDPNINALIGSHVGYLPDLQLLSAKYTVFQDPNNSNPLYQNAPLYYLAYRYFDTTLSKYVTVNQKLTLTPTTLHAGWNVIPLVLNGVNRALLVYGDDSPPTFVLTSPSGPTTINQADITAGSSIVIQGKILDDSLGPGGFKDFRMSFKLNDPTHVTAVQTRADGSQFITLSFTIKDFAGNTYLVSIDFDVTNQATLVQNIGTKTLPTIKVSVTLLALLTPVVGPV
jgi:hypothetical protein